MSLYKVYLEGKHKQVWDELVAVEAEVLKDEALTRDAVLVARASMLRAKSNIETIVARLRQMGYRFATESLAELFGPAMTNPSAVFAPPEANVHNLLQELENVVGPIPITLRSWFEIVGSVNLIGSHSTLSPRGGAASDPLVVMSPREILAELADGSTKPFSLPLFPSAQAKAGIAEGLICCVKATKSLDAQFDAGRNSAPADQSKRPEVAGVDTEHVRCTGESVRHCGIGGGS